MSSKNRLITQEELSTSIKWTMVEIVLNDPEYKKGSFEKEIEDLAYGLPEEIRKNLTKNN